MVEEQKKDSRVLVWVAAAVAVVLVAAMLVPLWLMTVFGAFVGAEQGGGAACAPGAGVDVVADGPTYTGPWINPVAGPLTSSYGPRINPVHGKSEIHSGQDIAAPYGTPIAASGSGVVTIAGASTGGNSGFMVAIDHGGGIQTRYVHPYEDEIYVTVGEEVAVGDHIADVGSSGNSTGAHLHFEVRINGQPTDPMVFMQNRGVQLGSDGGVSVEAADADQTDEKERPTEFVRGDTVVFRPNAQQLENLDTVAATVQARGETRQVQIIALITVLQESDGLMWANKGVPESLSYPHDAVGSDHDSVGLFQQRPSMGWGTVGELMDPVVSTHRFLDALQKVQGWQDMAPTRAADAVQRSAFPDAYAKWEPVARELLTGSNISSGAACTSTSPAAVAVPDGEEVSRDSLVAYARENLGAGYKAGGREPGAWDDDGFVWWVNTQAGVRAVPYVSAWTRGERTTSPEPGDLVASGGNGRGAWGRVGIKAEGNYYYTVTERGALKLPVPRDAEYFSLVGVNDR